MRVKIKFQLVTLSTLTITLVLATTVSSDEIVRETNDVSEIEDGNVAVAHSNDRVDDNDDESNIGDLEAMRYITKRSPKKLKKLKKLKVLKKLKKFKKAKKLLKVIKVMKPFIAKKIIPKVIKAFGLGVASTAGIEGGGGSVAPFLPPPPLNIG